MSTADHSICGPSAPAVILLEAVVLVVFERRQAANLAVREADAGLEWMEIRVRSVTWSLPSVLRMSAH